MTSAADSHALLLKACAAAGLSADQAEPIRIGENALWRLRHQVVARVGRPGQWDAAVRELAVARWLRTCDIPAVRPLDHLREPLDVEGSPVTFWHELPEHRPGTAADIAPLLRRIHELPIPDFPLGRLAPFVRLAARIDNAATLDDEQRQWLRQHLADRQAAWSELPAGLPTSVIHGDAWGGNVAVTPATAYLLDFERTSQGPPEWDLTATAVGHGTFGTVSDQHYEAFCEAYGADVTTWAGYPILRDIRELRVTCFALQHAAADPHRHREEAHHRLACIQGQNGPRPWNWTAVG
ncbi:aminoglycoside phosphotransferase family protein [Kitasatospora sp. NBC_00240]|uniref:phosphotransferase enzyme family protein n=1 Tax=Kitasatospora sp. NBC_00240 TaxID=2903567 RepID=UPI00225B265D|nr:aminoglycoside phosphotransferase family protein [Kitasatospora sp. NBC_00240]MCX5211848.1 aminoglycoside phosphotransferase family protein [Kitasatospora sp. NBC_00240]